MNGGRQEEVAAVGRGESEITETGARLSERSLELLSTSRRGISKGRINHKFLHKESESLLQRMPI